MSFTPRTFESIRDDMINYVKVQTTLTDFEIGSVVRTVIEAAALEDDEQYFQMVQLLDAFSIQTATGTDLDNRVADYNITRLQPVASAGKVVVQNLLLTQSPLASSIVAGVTSVQVTNSAAFPTAGYPYAIRIGEGSVTVEDLLVTNNNIITNTFTLQTGTSNAHSLAERLALVSGAADQIIASAIQVQVPAIGNNPAIKFVTLENGTLVNGNYESTEINTKAIIPGVQGNIGSNQISQYVSSPPFSGAGIRNVTAFRGGREIETDTELRDRARNQIQSLSRGTVAAIKNAALGVADPTTGQSVTTANVLEDFISDEVILYIDDGTGFTPDTVELADDVLLAGTGIGSGTLTVVDPSNFPNVGYVIVSPESTTQIELLRYTAINYATGVMTLATTTLNTHDISDEVVLVNVLTLNAESGTKFLNTQNFPIIRSSNRLWINSGGSFQLQSDSTNYFLNRGTGEVEFNVLLSAGVQVVITYKYYTGLVKTVQTVIDGDLTDPVNFPGIRAAGIVVLVETPVIRRITVRLSITAKSGFVEADLVPSIRNNVETYISSLGIGGDVIIADIIQQTMNVNGVYNVVVVTPSSDLVILQDELPVPFASDGTTLVTVT